MQTQKQDCNCALCDGKSDVILRKDEVPNVIIKEDVFACHSCKDMIISYGESKKRRQRRRHRMSC